MIRPFFKKLITGVLLVGSFCSSHLDAQDKALPPAHPLIVIMLGPPGAGKGTQASLLTERLHLPHISTGDLLREHVRKETALGKKAKAFMDKGELVPDLLILDMLFDRVSQADCSRGYILDGFPRTLPQAEAFHTRLDKSARVIAILTDLSDEKIVDRITKRVMCEKCGTPYHLSFSPPKQTGVCDKCGGKLYQRNDDTKEVVLRRLEVYHKQTAPLIHYYTKHKLLHTIDCNQQSKEQILAQILSILPKGDLTAKN